LFYRLTSADWQGRQSCLKGLLDPLSISRGQVVLGAQIVVRPECGLIGGAEIGEFGQKSVA
jgi:hypothetical protein